mmetsp:Transcript_16708/g.24700  ORF Transcript_16708/g.24700 Transcript_16708/m.24700 type:complete len:159 (+) Transcript_16708:524-1000(+)
MKQLWSFFRTTDTTNDGHHYQNNQAHFIQVLPVIALEFLAIAITKAVLPGLLIKHFGFSQVYIVMGCAECVKGLLAFVCCPWFGKVSDTLGRKPCLFWTVAGTCAPVAALALLPWESRDLVDDGRRTINLPSHDYLCDITQSIRYFQWKLYSGSFVYF